jgi:DNA-binding transcriptional MerR regulator/methylmalonyl-CoA mutase cobalamin-binding subunit
MVATSTASEPAYPIRTVAALTGINPITLRAWERRYGLVNPKRSAGGQRLYSRGDIDAVQRFIALRDRGVAAGPAVAAGEPEPVGVAAAPHRWRAWRSQLAAAIAQFDEARLEELYEDMLALYPIERVTRDALVPLLADLGDRWRTRPGGVAEEHFFAVYLRNKLGARYHHRSTAATGPKLLVACLPGEQHEIGAFLFALAAHERGHRLVLLGADTPLAELAYAARRTQADAIVISGSVELDPAVLAEELPRLVSGVRVPVFVGGPVSVRCRDQVHRAGAVPLGTDIPVGLGRIGRVLSRPASRSLSRPPSHPKRAAGRTPSKGEVK